MGKFDSFYVEEPIFKNTMKKYHVLYDKRYKISGNALTINANNLEEAKEKAHKYAEEHSPTNFDFSNTVVTEE